MSRAGVAVLSVGRKGTGTSPPPPPGFTSSLKFAQAPTESNVFDPTCINQANTAGLGLVGIRHNIQMVWNAGKTSPIAGPWDWSVYVPQWNAMQAAGLKLYGTLFEMSAAVYPLGTTQCNLWAAQALSAAQYLYANYPGMLIALEIENEPDGSWPIPAANFPPIAAALKTAIRGDATLNNVMIAGPTVTGEGQYAQDCINGGLLNSIDWWSHHMYSTADTFENRIANLRSKLSAAGHGSMPIFVSEYGGFDSTDAPKLAGDLTTLTVCNLVGASYFLMQDISVFPDAGLLNTDGSSGVQATAWKTWFANIGPSATFGARDSLASNVNSYRFTVGGATRRVVWASSATPQIIVTGTYTAQNVNGTTITPSGSHTLGVSPIYIFGTVTIAMAAGDVLIADHTAEFSLVQGQSGWRYQWLIGTTYTDAQVDNVAGDWMRPAAPFWQIAAQNQHPSGEAGSNVYALRKWTVSSGTTRVRVQGTWLRGTGGTGSDVFVRVTRGATSTVRYRRGALLNQTVSFNQVFDVLAGDIIEFAVGAGPNVDDSFDATTLQALIYSTTAAVNLPDDDQAPLTNLGDPDVPATINNGLVLFVGGAPIGSLQAGTERISRNALQYVSGDVARADPDISGWVIPETTTLTGVIYTPRPSSWNTAVGNRYAVWADVILDALDTTSGYSTLIAVPWQDVWSPPYVVMGMSRIGTGTAANITYTPTSGTLVTVNGPAGSWPATLGRHTIGVVRDGDNVLWFCDGSQIGGTTTGAGTAAPAWTSAAAQKPICLLGRSDTDATANGTDGGLVQLRIWAIPGGTTAAQMITTMQTLQANRNNGRFAPAAGAIEPVNGSLTQVTMTADSTPQQRWDGFGFTMGGPYDTNSMAGAAQSNHVQLFDELKAKWTGGYAADSIYGPFAQVCKNNGITSFLATGQCATQYTPEVFASNIAATIGSCFWTHASLQNEPDGGQSYEVYAGGYPEIVNKSQRLRTALNSNGLSAVKVIANGYSHFSGGGVIGEYNALNNAGLIPNTVMAGNGHAYGDNASEVEWTGGTTNVGWASYRPQGMFETEGGYGHPQTSPARMLSNLNNGVGVYFHFGSQIPANPTQDALDQGLVQFNGTRQPCHYSYQVINQDLTLGSLFRLVHCDDRPTTSPPNSNPTWFDRMIRRQTPYVPRLYASVAKRPDGTWWLACCNGTFDADFFNQLGGHYGAHDFQVTFQITELAGINLHWTGRRANTAGSSLTNVAYDMVNGSIRLTLLAGETVALASS